MDRANIEGWRDSRKRPAGEAASPCRPPALDLLQHLSRLAELLTAEREEERARLAEARGRLSLAEREARGLAIADAEATAEGALAGRALVTFGRGGRPLPGGRIGVGSLVSVTLR